MFKGKTLNTTVSWMRSYTSMRKEAFISKLKFEFVRRQKNCAYLKQKLQEDDQTLRRSQELRTELQFVFLKQFV